VNPPNLKVERLQFLVRVTQRECKHLATTDERLFNPSLGFEQIATLETNADLAERVEAFVGRFGRLQDTLGDKLLPALLAALGEKAASVADNLDRAERLGFLESAETWFTIRNLRNQMVHEYVEDPLVLHSALLTGHVFVPVLLTVADRILAELKQRGWLSLNSANEAS
jgi:hypothetical protein